MLQADNLYRAFVHRHMDKVRYTPLDGLIMFRSKLRFYQYGAVHVYTILPRTTEQLGPRFVVFQGVVSYIIGSKHDLILCHSPCPFRRMWEGGVVAHQSATAQVGASCVLAGHVM